MELSAVLFDMDGVLIETEAAIARLWNALASDVGLSISDADFTDHIHGCSPEHTVQTVFSSLPPRDRARVLSRVRESEPALGFDPVPRAVELVHRLAAAEVPLGLVTGASSSRAERVLRALGLSDSFLATVTWGESAHGKPAPDCYLLAARRLGVPPSRCLVFEDTSSGVRAAVTAGAVCVGVSRTDAKALTLSGARRAVPDFGAVRCDTGGGDVVLVVADEERFRFSPGTSPRGAAPSAAAER
jgi:sugar-phosphatase